jgi:phosphatidylinositol glycan class B
LVLERVSERQIFWSVLLLAAVIRGVAAVPFMVGWYDEIWQYLEPAWHLVEGPWVQTWDFRAGIRSWMLPQIISVPMALGHWLSPDTNLHLLLPRLTMAALSLLVVGCATSLGLRLSRLHGLLAGVVAAVWFELVFFAPRLLAEPIGFSLMMGAVWLLVARKAAPEFRHYFFAGILIGLSFAVRIQYAPILMVLVVFSAQRDWRHKWGPLILGGLAALSIDAAANLMMGNMPFRWMLEAVRINIVEGRASVYGTTPWLGYPAMIAVFWSLLLAPVILTLAWRGQQRYPVLFWMALVHLVVHSLIAHKEYRFILASTGLIVILAALAAADVLRALPRERLMRGTIGMLIVWIGASAALANWSFKPYWSMLTDMSEAHMVARGADASCGFALLTPLRSVAGSYALYKRASPIYAFDTAEELAGHSSAFNIIMTDDTLVGQLPKEFNDIRCGEVGITDTPNCVAKRAGRCSGNPAQHHINEWLRRNDN